MSNARKWLLAGGILLVLAALLSTTSMVNPFYRLTCGNEIHFFALEEDKESEEAFGPKVVEVDQDPILAELHDRRCQDPALVAAHASAWGLIEMEESVINQYSRALAANPDAWREVILILEDLESESTKAIVDVPAGVPTQYMTLSEDGSWVDVFYGTSGFDGPVIQFTHLSGAVVQLRLLCGFQPVWPPGLPPPPPPPEEECPPTECLTPKSDDPADWEYADDKPVVPEVTTPAEATPPVVETEAPGGRGVIDTPTNTPGDESGVTAPGADPAPTTAPSLPPNQGGDNGEGDTGGFN